MFVTKCRMHQQLDTTGYHLAHRSWSPTISNSSFNPSAGWLLIRRTPNSSAPAWVRLVETWLQREAEGEKMPGGKAGEVPSQERVCKEELC